MQKFYISRFYKINYLIDSKLLTLIYLSFVLPLIEYCSLIYVMHGKINLKKINLLNDKLLSFTNIKTKFNFDNRIKIKCIKLIKHILNNEIPNSLSLLLFTSKANTRKKILLPIINYHIYNTSRTVYLRKNIS